MKKILKNKKFLLGFILGAFIFGTTGVLAVTYYASKDVTYDNTESGMTSENVQDAIDELYQLASAIDVNGAKIPTVTSGDGLYADSNEEGRYVYKGSVSGTNNYIQFNNELWRIVSIETDGTIKILRNSVLSDRAWDSTGGTYGSNNWARPADLNTYLNGTYYNGLNATAQSQIASHTWGVGAVSYSDVSLSNAIADEKGTTWSGKVGLISTTDYVRASTNASCTSVNAYYNSSSCSSNSTNHNWMYLNDRWWTISPRASSSYVFFVYSDGAFFSGSAYGSNVAPRPAAYLSSEISITGGSGTSSDPYTIG